MPNLPGCVGDYSLPAGEYQNNPLADTEVDVYNGNQLIDTIAFRSSLISGAYVVISENTSFDKVVLTDLASGQMSTTYNALIGDVEAVIVAPEPGTIGLLSLGLAGVAYFARRRKA